jgi:primosomal protein N' (replication factor Y) (superfamily II helicase)
MSYAEVSVNSPVAQRRTYSYSIPPGLDVAVGQAVWVPFGNRTLQGIVLEVGPCPAYEETREIAGIIEACPLLSPSRVRLARWISEYYLSPLFDAVALMLPPGFERKTNTYVSLAVPSDQEDPPGLTLEQKGVMEIVRQGKTGLSDLEQSFGTKQAGALVSRLVSLGLLARSYEIERVRVKAKSLSYLSLAVSADAALAEAAKLLRAKSQARLLTYLAEHPHPVPLAEAKNATGAAAPVVDALLGRGLVSISTVTVTREPVRDYGTTPATPLTLTAAQHTALDAITAALSGGEETGKKVFLLHGVTGSGKTEVYLQALARAVEMGKKAIVLVPEIALTPQTIERFAGRFPRRVAVLHSGLSLGEQYDEWERIREGEFDVVVGPRSALFAPQPDLGLIIIDEEHEWTYKQADRPPRYHAREVALRLARETGAVLVMGSATPDVVTYFSARRGDYVLLPLAERVTPFAGAALPPVELVDLREELKAGNRSLFSRSLSQAIARSVAAGQQVILFLNRRGGATFVQCRGCGLVLRCKRCGTTLTYHPVEAVLRCHQCNYHTHLPESCPRCRGKQIKLLGLGTQKLEQETVRCFPGARVLRWDSDAVHGKNAHRDMMEAIQAHRADILIGTQMIAKGLDLPLVTLVGVVSADTSLNLPDFRAGERTFQLLAQVAGRAGRGEAGGRVIIQTYAPENYAVTAASAHDYAAFYEKEINYRRQLRQPPFTQFARLVYSHTREPVCQQEAERLKAQLEREIAAAGIAGIEIIGPAPAYVSRLRGRYRWQMVLRGAELSDFLSGMTLPRGWAIDIDPLGLV